MTYGFFAYECLLCKQNVSVGPYKQFQPKKKLKQHGISKKLSRTKLRWTT